MKKIISFLVLILMCLLFSACSDNLKSPQENYSVTYDGNSEYSYVIYNNKKEIMDSFSSYKIVEISRIDKNILQKRYGAGNAICYQFYDTEKNLVSPIYYNIDAVDYGKIVYMTISDEVNKLIVTDLFDDEKYYREYERDFSPTAIPSDALKSANFISENKIEICYLKGNDYSETSEVIDLKWTLIRQNRRDIV